MAATNSGDNASGDSRSLNVIRSWDDCPVVPPEVLREWLAEEIACCESECREIMERVESVRSGPNADKLQAATLLENDSEFLSMANPAIRNLSDDEHPAIPAAFTAGLRLGMIYWNLRRIRAGLLKRVWDAEDHCENMRDVKAEADAERRSENRERALEALEWAKYNFPVAAEDKSHDVLMNKAAEHAGISRRQFNRWLGGR